MPKLSEKSLERLYQCHPDLVILFLEVIKYFDFTITEGYRSQVDQDKAFAEGKTQLKWPNGKHNNIPSLAVDAYPYPVDMQDTRRFYYFAGFVLGVACGLKAQGKISHDIRWGGDWNRDTQVKDNGFNDLVHFEIVL